MFNNGQIDLMGLPTADSYTYQNDMLSIFSGSSVIDTLHLHDSTPYGFVAEPPTAGASVNIGDHRPQQCAAGAADPYLTPEAAGRCDRQLGYLTNPLAIVRRAPMLLLSSRCFLTASAR